MDFSLQVAAGIKLLDEKVPGWRAKINLSTLDIRFSDLCILGQLYGNYTDGRFNLSPHLNSIESCEAHGFTPICPPGVVWHRGVEARVHVLTAEWIKQLTTKG